MDLSPGIIASPANFSAFREVASNTFENLFITRSHPKLQRGGLYHETAIPNNGVQQLFTCRRVVNFAFDT
ncbi:MAG: hypothetical protein VX075_07915, partial [Pseudomonadota bacterium]|nr:hypothetical protein [Pseudomonadota bacterium]